MGGQGHRKLAGREDDGVEVGVKFASDVFRTEKGADHENDFQHGECFEETDKETAYDDDVHLVDAGADEAEQGLQQEIGEQYGFGGDNRAQLGDDGVGHGHSGRGGVIGHPDVFAQYAQGAGYFRNVAGVGAVDEDNGEHDDEGRKEPQPPGNPGADRDVDLLEAIHGRGGYVGIIFSGLRLLPSFRPAAGAYRLGWRRRNRSGRECVAGF